MNEIHDTAMIDDDVVLGENNKIDAYVILRGPLEIGNNNAIGPNVVIGTPGQDTKNPHYDCSKKKITIGDDNIIREFTAIHKPLDTEVTSIGSRVYLMHNVHVPHDAIIQDDVVMTPMSVLAGNAKILRAANLGIGVQVHQHNIVGQFAMIAMGAAVNKNIKPFAKFIPGRPLSLNEYALKKFGLMDYLDEIQEFVLNDARPTSEKILEIVDEFLQLHEQSGRKLY